MKTRLTPLFAIALLLVPAGARAQGNVNSILAGMAGPGGEVRQLNAADGATLTSLTPFGPGFNSGVRVASGDIDGDGTPDIIVGTGSGGQVRVIRGSDLTEFFTLTAFNGSFNGGVYVAAGDIDNDGRADVIAGAGHGGGEIRVFSGHPPHNLIATRTPFGPSYKGGVTVASADIGGDGWDDLVAGTASNGTYVVLDGRTGTTIVTVTPYGPGFTHGIYVAAGDVNGDSQVDVITGPGRNLNEVRVFNGVGGTLINAVTAYPPGGAGGVYVAAGDVNADGFADIITGPAQGAPLIKILDGQTSNEIESFLAFATPFNGGVFVAAVADVQTAPVFTSADATTFQVGVFGTFEVTTAGGAAAVNLSFSGTLPDGVTFTNHADGTATLEGTPTAGEGGVYPLVFHADDGINPAVDQNFTLTVNEAPAITSADNAAFNLGMSSSFTVTSTGFPTPALSEAGALPTGISFTDNGDGTADITGTPTQGGTFPITITAANGVSPDAIQLFTLTVLCPAITVSPSGALPDGLFGVAYGPVNFTQVGSTGTVTWSATGLPAGLSIDGSTGVLSGTPANTVLNAAVVVTATDQFGCSGSSNLTITIRPLADNDAYTGGVGHTQFAVGVVGIATPHVFVAGNVKGNDAGPGPIDVTFGAAGNGAVVEGATDGTFVYTPNLNFAGPSDSFSYTLTDANGVTDTATVTIALSRLVWYVNSAGANGDGRSHAPFNNLVSAGAPLSPTSTIFVHTGAATTTGALTLDPDQTLHGQAVALMINGLIIPAGTAPTLTGTVTLNNFAEVRGVNSTPAGSPAFSASGLNQSIDIDNVNVTGGTTALLLLNVSAPSIVTVTASTFTNTSGAELLVSGGNGVVNMGASISSNVGQSVLVQLRTGGTVSITGAIADQGTGILLNGNAAAATTTFSGGITLEGASSTFTATGGGRVNVTGINTIGAATAAAGAALSLVNTTIGPSGVTFRSISSTGGAKGLVLNNTGSGAFTVTGTGSAGSGGTIRDASVRGAELISASNLSLAHMNFAANGTAAPGLLNALCADALAQSITVIATVEAQNCEANVYLQSTTGVVLNNVSATRSKASGIWGNNVSGLTLTNVDARENGDEVLEDGVQLVNLNGTAIVTGGTFIDNASRAFEVQNNTGTPALTIDGGSFGNTNFPAAVATAPSPSNATANGAVLLATNGTNGAAITSTTRNATFDRIFGVAFFVSMSGNTSQNVTFGQAGQGNTVTTATQGVSIVGTNSGGLVASIADNTLNNDETLMDTFSATSINVRRGGGLTPASGDWSVTIDGNDVGINGDDFSGCETAGCSGISADDQGSPSGIYTAVIQNNSVFRVSGPGILVSNANAGAHTTNATIVNNTVGDPELNAVGAGGVSQGAGILVQNGGGTTATTNARIEDNVVSGFWDGAGSRSLIRVRHAAATAAMNLCGYIGSTAADVSAFLAAENPGTVDPDGAGPFVVSSALQPIGDPIGNGCP